MNRQTVIKLVVIVSVIAVLVVGFQMVSGSKASLSVPKVSGD